MPEFFRDGGYNMWVMLFTAIAVAAYAAAGPRAKRERVLAGGIIVLIVEGIFGLSTGMMAVSRNFGRFPDKVEAIGQGLGELANNGTFCAGLCALLGLAYLAATRANRGEPARAPLAD